MAGPALFFRRLDTEQFFLQGDSIDPGNGLVILFGGGDAEKNAMHKAWTLKGFGLWARVHPGTGLEIVDYVMNLLREQGVTVGLNDSLPHSTNVVSKSSAIGILSTSTKMT